MSADWHAASIGYALQNVAIVTRTDEVIAALDGGATPAAGGGPGRFGQRGGSQRGHPPSHARAARAWRRWELI